MIPLPLYVVLVAYKDIETEDGDLLELSPEFGQFILPVFTTLEEARMHYPDAIIKTVGADMGTWNVDVTPN